MKTKIHISRHLRRFARADEAVSALEYAVLVGVVVVGIGAALVTFQNTITTAIEGIGTDVTTASDIQGAANPTP